MAVNILGQDSGLGQALAAWSQNKVIGAGQRLQFQSGREERTLAAQEMGMRQRAQDADRALVERMQNADRNFQLRMTNDQRGFQEKIYNSEWERYNAAEDNRKKFYMERLNRQHVQDRMMLIYALKNQAAREGLQSRTMMDFLDKILGAKRVDDANHYVIDQKTNEAKQRVAQLNTLMAQAAGTNEAQATRADQGGAAAFSQAWRNRNFRGLPSEVGLGANLDFLASGDDAANAAQLKQMFERGQISAQELTAVSTAMREAANSLMAQPFDFSGQMSDTWKPWAPVWHKQVQQDTAAALGKMSHRIEDISRQAGIDLPDPRRGPMLFGAIGSASKQAGHDYDAFLQDFIRGTQELMATPEEFGGYGFGRSLGGERSL